MTKEISGTEKIFYSLRLLPPRPDFFSTMTEQELAIMEQHKHYWKTLMAENKVIVYGPVLDPAGPYGLGVVQVDSEEEVKQITDQDPANGLHRYVYFPMLAVVPALIR